MTHSDVTRWQGEIEKIPWKDVVLKVPLDVIIGESVEVAKFVDRYWEASGSRPGLMSAGERLPRGIGGEILSIRAAVLGAETTYRLIIEPKREGTAIVERAKFVLSEITATLDWVLDDGVTEDADEQVLSLKRAHADDTGRADLVAQALHDYATLAKPLAARMAAVGGFDPALIDEGLRLSLELGDVRQTPAPPSAKAEDALRLRNGLAFILQERVALVRSAARFVFRRHPEVTREVTSVYERRRRAEAKRREASKRAATTPPIGL